MRKKNIALMVLATSFAYSAQIFAADLVFIDEDGGAGGPRGIYDFNSKTGISNLRASLDFGPNFFSIAKRPSDGTIFAMDTITDLLYEIDIDTGEFTFIAATGLDTIGTITFHPKTGQMYGLGRNTSNLYIIDPDDGSSLLVGDAAPARSGLTFHPDGTLFALEIFDGDLYTIDPSNAIATFVGGSGDVIPQVIEDADFTPDGDLFITDFTGVILQINPLTGHRTIVGNSGLGSGLLGLLANLPEPNPCPWDLDGSDSVGTSDLLELFAQWGTAGPADFDESGAVGTSDLLILFANWGPCP